MAADVKIDIAAEFVGIKAFKQAGNAVDGLTKGVKRLAGGFGVAFGLQGAKMAVKAFAADDKAARQLSLTLNNLGLQFADPAAKTFIADLEKQYGVVDDLLRPAFQKLITSTSDFKLSQDLLKTSLNLAAMSGTDVVSVADDLARAYTGNTKGLQKYGLGIDKATLATMSFDDILTRINAVSAGQAEEAANGISGSLDRLNVAASNAAESIGKDLVNALTTLGGEGGLPKTLSLIESVASGIGDAAIGFSRLIRNASILLSNDRNIIESIRLVNKLNAKDRAADAKERAVYGGIYAEIYKNEANAYVLGKKKLDQTTKLTAEQLKQLKAKQLQTAIDKANLALNKGNDVFNLDAIQIQAALINQAEQLGKATTSSQILQIANDTARLKIKQDILNLEAAIAAGDEASITASTNKLNADMKILSSLQQQNLKLIDIKSLLESLVPKDLINLANLQSALALLGQINLASTGSKTTPASTVGVAGGGNTAGNQYSNQVENGLYGMQVASSIDATNLNTALLGGVVSAIGSNLKEYLTPNPAGFGVGAYDVNITVNTGVGDPNAIADAINQVIQDAVDRGTLRGGSY
jgi:hypothetical protein